MSWVSRARYITYYYVCFLVLFFIRWVDGLALVQLGKNPINTPRQDPIMWLWHWIKGPQLFSGTVMSYTLTMTVMGLPLVILYLQKQKKNNRQIILTHILLTAIFIITIYAYPTLSVRKYLPMVLVPLAFVFATDDRYRFAIRSLRYWVCYVFASAALWKIARGVVWDSHHMVETIRSQHIDNIVHWPNHYVTKIASWLISNPQMCYALLVVAVISQLTFAIGFFTRKYDKWLIALLITFVIADYLVMRIEYWEYVLLLPLFFSRSGTQARPTTD